MFLVNFKLKMFSECFLTNWTSFSLCITCIDIYDVLDTELQQYILGV